jgi:hypothetical protein
VIHLSQTLRQMSFAAHLSAARPPSGKYEWFQLVKVALDSTGFPFA